MSDAGTLGRLALVFGALSLVSFGGANSVLPAMHHDAVAVQHWLTDREFADVFTIAQMAPGPSSLIVGLIGFRAAGLPGAVVATVAMLAPSCAVVYAATRGWNRFRESKWRVAIEHGLAPITVGLVFASAVTVVRAADHGPAGWALTAAATALFAWTSINPLLIVGAAALLGAAGLV